MSASATARIIGAEHEALAAVLRTMMMVNDARHHDQAPDFKSLRAMLFYVDEFPERLHHVNATMMLFPRLRGFCSPTLVRLSAGRPLRQVGSRPGVRQPPRRAHRLGAGGGVRSAVRNHPAHHAGAIRRRVFAGFMRTTRPHVPTARGPAPMPSRRR
jgi:hypothetical protein